MNHQPKSLPSPWPARLDLAQSASGLFLALFMWAHMAFVSSILVSEQAFWSIARMFEGYYIFGRPLPWLVSAFVLFIFVVMLLHAALAMRKFPSNWRQYRAIGSHAQAMRHGDTSLWLVQLVTGFLLMFLAGVHLYAMGSEPELIDPYGSADLVWTGRTWPLLFLLLLCVEVHGLVGLYRLALKWGWPTFGDAARTRRILRRLMWGLILFFLTIGLITLSTFMRIGMAHAPNAGELWLPAQEVSQ